MARGRGKLRVLIFASVAFGVVFLFLNYYEKYPQFDEDFQINGIKVKDLFRSKKLKEAPKEVPGSITQGIEKEEEAILTDISTGIGQRVEKINKLRRQNLAKQCLLSKVVTNTSLFDYTHPRMRDLINIYQKSSDRQKTPPVPRLLVSDQHKALYCAIDGAAMETWEMVIMMLEQGYGKSLEHADQRYLTHDNLRPLWDYRPIAIEYRLKNYYKFMFVRNPINRLLYTFQHRFPHEKLQSEKHFGNASWSNQVKKDHVSTGGKILKKEVVTLSRFVSHLTELSKSEREMDAMIGSFVQLCMPCHIQYDFIGRTETIKDDFQFLLGKVGVEEKGFGISPIDQKTMSELFENLSKLERDELYKMYKLDYSIFGYSYP